MGSLHENKNIGGGGLSTQLDQQKRLQCKKAQKCNKISKLENFFLARFAHTAFYNIHISGAANRHTPVQYALYVIFLFFSKQSS